ncbi:MAG: chloride channel protein, partial [Candidatus Marinimicrobia bacterium]|nr:chloride channel protein [Candidatus Neomarinimicrobiota bacterium]
MRTIRKTLKNNPATKHFLVFILRIIQSFIAAGSAVFVVYTFNRLVLTMQRFELRLLPGQPVWTISGAFLVVMVIYKISPLSKIEGAQCYIDTVNKEKGHFIFKDTVFKYWASLFTLGTFGNGGILAPMGRVTAGLNCAVERKLHKIQKFDLKIGAISGFAATIGVIFHAPIAGGFFAVEILSKANMRYRYLFPALFSSALAVYFAKLLHLHPFYRFHIPTKEIPMGYYFYVLLIGMITGIVGRLYNEFYKLIVSISKRNEKKHLLLEVLIGATSVSLLAFFINPDLMGTSNNLIDQLTHDVENLRGNLPGSMNMIIVLVILLIVKMVGNCVTVGSGM